MKIIKSEKYQKNYHRFLIEVNSSEEITLFNTSDWHIDNPKCNRELLFKHLNSAVKKNALITITGDLFCLMQGKYDPRRSKSDIRPEHNQSNYLDLVINDTAEILRPYAKNIILISKGNHETSVSNRMETDVIERLVERLNTLENTNIQVGEYTGYYTLCFQYKSGGTKKSLHIGYSHGNWGGVITKGTLGVVRYAAIMPDCDVMFSGHTHDGWIIPQARLIRDSNKKTVEVKKQWHIKTGTYKEEFAEGKGWAVERIAMPKYLGSCFTNVIYNKNKDLEYTFTLTS
jgi:predicted phosphodiesterase